jgi:hypothetical protein
MTSSRRSGVQMSLVGVGGGTSSFDFASLLKRASSRSSARASRKMPGNAMITRNVSMTVQATTAPIRPIAAPIDTPSGVPRWHQTN